MSLISLFHPFDRSLMYWDLVWDLAQAIFSVPEVLGRAGIGIY